MIKLNLFLNILFFLTLFGGEKTVSEYQTETSPVLRFDSYNSERNKLPYENRGLYAILYSGEPEVLDLPYITSGEQIISQWYDLNPEQGKFDFKILDNELKKVFESGHKVIIQVDAGRKPTWLFDIVPYYPGKLSPQMSRFEKGTPMYWHESYLKAHTDFLEAWVTYLRKSPYRSVIIGIRHNINALDTEYSKVPDEHVCIDQWITPSGVEPGSEYTDELRKEYSKAIVTAYVNCFSNDFKVFFRNSIADEIREPFLNLWENGTLAWFHTSSEIEPRKNERQYQTFLDYCKTGKTIGYAEQWADAWGWHGHSTPDKRWCSPSQWNYWRLLCDLHCGVSIITVYGSDLRIAIDGIHRFPFTKKIDDKQYPEYINEFDQAFRFAAKYAGYAIYPAESPGAWIAFRHSTVNQNFNSPLKSLTGDYLFHMERLDNVGSIKQNVGPDNQRFGTWALELPEEENMRVAVDERFIKSLKGDSVKLKIIYLNKGTGKLNLTFGDRNYTQQLTDSKEWRTVVFTYAEANISDKNIITLSSLGQSVFLHMMEMERVLKQ